ncbi:Sec-independent protein translocase subunit TatA/TatB [Halobaculum magnesiiphilum]|uniref:Twin-arginine translocase TatA/TatE family subunit n=1 Tax=Halobaculum magnesiiphilum TaxID=1017351 RepID=A0A8T8WDH1_9EURY|nr:twin-arginine translocase TatA/TatE family subunit [Halobaculum magnesiiphilum]QZP37784.1 twin-arginine translocase TatA/TatE family subunit [Halobaculum magnesiiphilum]
MPTTLPLFGAIPGGPEMLIILLVLVLLFGANKIPKLARSTGQAMGEFKKGREQVEEELQEMQEGEIDEDDEIAADSTVDSTADSSTGSTDDSVETDTEKN